MSRVGNEHTTRPAPDATPTRRTDAEMASAFMDLESAIANLKRMSALMETAAEDTVFTVEGVLEKHIRDRSNLLDGYRIHVLTEDQSDSIDYAIRHMYDLTQALYRKYYGFFENKVA